MQMIEMKIECEPLPQSRPRLGRGRAYEEPRIKAYKQLISLHARKVMQGRKPMQGALKVRLYIYRKYKVTSRRFGDFDNHAKAILDALNGICFEDDSQIVSAEIHKVQSAAEGVEIFIDIFPII